MQFRRAWVEENCSNSVLNIITNGYILPFHLKPKLTRHPLIISKYKNQQKDLALASCIHSLLNKHAIEKVRNIESLGFYSRLFLVPKPQQKWRPVIDLSWLNQFLRIARFKMETPESIRASLNTGEWVTSIDLQDAYLHIPIHPRSRKYLRFAHRSHIYQFTSLPFGPAPAPQVFTMIVKEVKLVALSRGIRIHQYLDDWLIRDQSQHKSGGKPDQISRLDNKSGQVGVDSNSSVLFRGIRIPSELSPCKAHSGEVAKKDTPVLRRLADQRNLLTTQKW